MEVRLTDDQQELIQQAVANGRYHSADEAVRAALAAWEENERRRMELIASLEAAEADLEAGRYTDYTEETLDELVEEIKREGRALLEARRRK